MRSQPRVHTSRMIAACRVALALALLAPAAVNMASNNPAPLPAVAALAAYLAFSAGLLAIAWRDWWLDHHLRHIAFTIDALFTLLLLLYWLEGTRFDDSGPFFAFFVFLLVCANLLWRLRGLAITALLMIAAYIAVGLIIDAGFAHWQSGWYGQRLIFMIVISAFLSWFLQQPVRPVPAQLEWPQGASTADKIAAVQSFIRQHIPCSAVAAAWTPDQEPWVYVAEAGPSGLETDLLGPEAMDLQDRPPAPILFDRQRQRGMQLDDDGSLIPIRHLPACCLEDCLAQPVGICMPVNSRAGQGSFLITGVTGLTGNHLHIAAALAEEIAYAMDRDHAATVQREAEVEQVRQTTARDLHDSVVQSLAGASFQLEALRQRALAGQPMADALANVQQALMREGQLVEALIHQLRKSEDANQPHAAMMDIGTALADTADHWGVTAEFEMEDGIGDLPPKIAVELHHLLREAVSNAVRHGKADKVGVTLRMDGGFLQMDFTDNGTGFVSGDNAALPRSVLGRMRAIQGTLQLSSRPGHTRLSMRLPIG
jgi:signal transduction histidine kinase